MAKVENMFNPRVFFFFVFFFFFCEFQFLFRFQSISCPHLADIQTRFIPIVNKVFTQVLSSSCLRFSPDSTQFGFSSKSSASPHILFSFSPFVSISAQFQSSFCTGSVKMWSCLIPFQSSCSPVLTQFWSRFSPGLFQIQYGIMAPQKN